MKQKQLTKRLVVHIYFYFVRGFVHVTRFFTSTESGHSGIIYYVYECFGEYFKLASIVTRGRNFRKYDWFPVDSARRNSCAQIP